MCACRPPTKPPSTRSSRKGAGQHTVGVTSRSTSPNQASVRSSQARTQALLHWEDAPHARTCHAQEDHLVPLFAALGAAEGEAATRTYHDTNLFGGVTATSYRFG